MVAETENEIVIRVRGRKVRTHANGFVSLEDLQAAAGFKTNRTASAVAERAMTGDDRPDGKNCAGFAQ